MAEIDHETWWVNSNGYEEGYVWRNGERQQFKKARGKQFDMSKQKDRLEFFRFEKKLQARR